MSNTRFLTADALPGAVAALAATRRVLIPVRQPAVKQSVIFAPYATGMPVELMRATIPPKEAVLPQCETLISYRMLKDARNPGSGSRLELDDTPQAEATVVFGCRPCDARGFAVLDRPYLKGPFADPYYTARRHCLTVVTQTCPDVESTCFCHWTGGGPNSAEGSDVLLTAVADGYLLEAVTEKGDALLAALDGTAGVTDGTDRQEEARNARAAVQALLPAAPDLATAPQAVAARFADGDFWEAQTAQCLSCGACTYMCPTCYCFNITDEGDGVERPGRRIRTWDTCMSPLFTREASGHNARMTKAQRMRNRVSHKFSTYPGTWEGAFSCNGCGRCVSNCPVHLDIRDIVLAALNGRQGA
ncbi:MAG: 4Fe-4S dicluster domain-containing protein [Desulfovibrionaceae bacterium]